MELSQLSTSLSNTFLFLSPPEKDISQSRLLQKSLTCSSLLPTIYLIPAEKQVIFCHPFCMQGCKVWFEVVTGTRAPTASSRAHISTHRLALSWGPPTSLTPPAPSSGTWETRSAFLKLEELYNPVISYWLRGEGSTEGVYNFLARFFYSFQTSNRTYHHSDSLTSWIYSYHRLLFKEYIKISK